MDNTLKEIKSYINKKYPDLQFIKSIHRFEIQNVRSKKFLIRTRYGQYILTNFIRDVSPTKMENICKIHQKCYDKRLPIQEPILNKNNFFVDSSRRMYMTRFYYGTIFNGSISQIKEIGKEVAKLHRILKTITKYYRFSNSSKYNLLNNKEIQLIEKKINNAKKIQFIDKKILKDIHSLKKLINQQYQYKKNIKTLKLEKQLIHNDLHPKNVLFKNNKVKVILDFNSMKLGYVLEDIILASFRFGCFKNMISKQINSKMSVFLKSYSKNNIVDQDSNYLYRFFLYEYLLSRISYILRNKYIENHDLWISDYTKFHKFLTLIPKLKII